MSTFKVILVFVRRWEVPARHKDISNTYVKADTQKDTEIYLGIPQVMGIPDSVLTNFKVGNKKNLALQLLKSLYGLKQAGRLWSQLLHNKFEEAEFSRCTTDMCIYYKSMGNDMIVVGVYVDDVLVTATTAALVQDFFISMGSLLIEDLGDVRKFLVMRIKLNERNGYTFSQQTTIEYLLEQHGLTDANEIHRPIGDESNGVENEQTQPLEQAKNNERQTIKDFQSLVGSLL